MNKIIKIVITASFFVATSISAQVAIGKDNLTNSSVLLEFGNQGSGIILPSVDDAPGAVGGTFIYNKTATVKAVEVWEERQNNGAGGWLNLTSKLDPSQPDGVNHTLLNIGNTDTNQQGAIIGANTSSKPGVLVLESSTKAMVLPKIQDAQLLRSAVAGTMLYDTTSDTLAVYDGATWSYWR